MGGTVHHDPEIAPYFRASGWKKLNLNDLATPDTADWMKAISTFESRIGVRFFEPVDALVIAEKGKKPKRYGFVTLAIDCLLIETLQGFYEGICDHTGHSGPLFKAFLKRWDAFTACVSLHEREIKAALIYSQVRCALHHSGATGSNCRIGVSGPPFAFNGNKIELNRVRFHDELKLAFAKYVSELKDPVNLSLRQNFKTKMEFICA